ncbi:nicotinate-nucleotide adenylyltransferase [Shimazuella sp. AN120528]|uniref:nicotinate-nucleotide adenylyltransferase n=1 Tax=Shimazuella soli TaxID=1892854 RepID=UPI001F0CED90|nr:nicotinate-nucleotide adenylyltransferase [Shimazuella soli]MCH5583787.1 nicotinate-nucleotide adenylyltransferase [Shimazuella soli]
MKIGIIGGTFDPVHMGHLLIAEQARDRMELDKVWFIPTGQPPHKQGHHITPAKHRLAMVQIATEENSAFEVLDWEIKREKLSYTIDTVNWAVNTYPTYQFSLIVGTDMVNNLPSWYQIDKLVQHVSIIAMHRPGFTAESLPEFIQEKVRWVDDAVEIFLSASQLRNNIIGGRSFRYAVPSGVCRYIEEHQLYEPTRLS